MRTYEQVIKAGDVLLMDGANGTRLRFETGLELDPVLDIAGLAQEHCSDQELLWRNARVFILSTPRACRS